MQQQLANGELVKVAGGNDDAALHLHQPGAELWIARAPARAMVTVPGAPRVHVFVARGDATLDSTEQLATGDAARLTDAGTPRLDVGSEGAEIVIWTTA